MNKWTITLEEDPENGDLVLPLNDDILKELGWEIGDTLIWTDNKDGSWTLHKKDNEQISNTTE
jgi:hypothetical protein